jgi:pyrroline-5-carboxylate reductase
MVNLPTIAIIGTGSMGGAILTGLLAPGVSVAGGIRVTNRTPEKAAALAEEGAAAAVRAAAAGYADANMDAASAGFVSYALEETPNANALAVAGARIVLIGVKPHMVPDLLISIAPSLEPDALVISVAAGVPIATMEALVPISVARAMPNTPAVVGLAVTGLAAGTRTSDDDMALARTLFETVGSVLVVPESKIDALSTISGSGPAYVFYLIEELTRTAVGLGFTPEEAAVMVNGTFRGASELLAASDGVAPGELRRRVTSPGGTTERAIAELQAGDLAGLFDRATAAALARATELAAG